MTGWRMICVDNDISAAAPNHGTYAGMISERLLQNGQPGDYNGDSVSLQRWQRGIYSEEARI